MERLGALTAADRRWMDDIVRDVNEEWNDKDPSRPLTMQFKGSDDYLRAKVCGGCSMQSVFDRRNLRSVRRLRLLSARVGQICRLPSQVGEE